MCVCFFFLTCTKFSLNVSILCMHWNQEFPHDTIPIGVALMDAGPQMKNNAELTGMDRRSVCLWVTKYQ